MKTSEKGLKIGGKLVIIRGMKHTLPREEWREKRGGGACIGWIKPQSQRIQLESREILTGWEWAHPTWRTLKSSSNWLF